MTALTLDEAIRRIIAVGGDINHIALNDNFVWPSPLPHKDNPDAKYKMAQLVRANEALYEYTRAFGTPCISGKDSMSMDSTEIDADGKEVRVSAPPTMQFSAIGVMQSWEQAVTMDAKSDWDLVYVIGLTKDECGGSEYYKMKGETGLNIAKVDAPRFRDAYGKLGRAIRKGLVRSAHGCYKGGLGVALAQTAFAGGFGMYVNLKDVPTDGLGADEKILYSESAGRFVVTVPPEMRPEFEKIMKGADFAPVGMTMYETDNFIVRGLGGDALINENIYALKDAWQSTFKHMNYHPLEEVAA
jgi:phosphoribosylformylglycinamidine synthase